MEKWSKHWHVVIYVVGLVFLAGTSFSENNAQTEHIKDNLAQIEKEGEKVRDMDERLIRIEEKQKNAVEDIVEIKDDVKEILRELRER